jgi:hypothetical protein
MFETTWDPNAGTATYAMSENEYDGTSPFLWEGYVMWPIPVTVDGYPACSGIHCGSGESICTDAYYAGEFQQDMIRRQCVR